MSFFFVKKTSVLCIMVMCMHYTLPAQHLSWHNYTVDNGLPSNEIYGMMQDSRGFLWLATNLGVCRFNGYEFVSPADTSVAAMSSAFHLAEDARGRIWFNRLDGSLWIIENDTVRPWAHNALAREFGLQKLMQPSLRFSIDDDGSVWIASWGNGFLVVQPDGMHQIVPALGRNIFVVAESGDHVLVAREDNQKYDAEITALNRFRQTLEIVLWQAGQTVSIGHFPTDYSTISENSKFCLSRMKNGDQVAAVGKNYYLIRHNRLAWHDVKKFAAYDLVPDGDGLLVVVRGDHRGLMRFRTIDDYQHDRFDNLLPGRAVSAALRDHEGGLWAATTDRGVFYCKNTELDVFDTDAGLPVNSVLQLVSDGKGRIFAGLDNLDIAVFSYGEGGHLLMPRPPIHEMTGLHFDTIAGRIWAANYLCYWHDHRWILARLINHPAYSSPPVGIKKITAGPSGDRWWGASFSGFYAIDPRAGTALQVQQGTLNERTFSVTPDPSGDLWVTTLDGLHLWRDGRYLPPPFSHPALRYQPRQVETLPAKAGGGLVIALRGGGLLIRSEEGHFTHLTTRDGLSADWISELDTGPDGTIYACSGNGLSILTPQHGGNWSIGNFTAKHGLPSNLVHDVALSGQEIWVATDEGIARFHKKPAPLPMPPPQLDRFRVNNRDTAFTSTIRLKHDRNNLSLRFFSLHFRSGGDISYRYRLLPGNVVFTTTKHREANFAQLPSGHYTFEVQAQNEDGHWSEPAYFAFRILPPWWASTWFRVLAGSILAQALWLFYRIRLQAIRHEALEREKIRDLETAALRAQMNPHFIFNCLQAIQSFIAENDRDAAATYLARFARLVRLALHGSVDGRHTLADEMAMLENYLYLEQLRFRGKFEFTVRAENGSGPEEIRLPPLLVQPFVENALIHGLQGRESGGTVDVFFARKADTLEVTVTDNGRGFAGQHQGESNLHKSVGIMLTQKRLDLLAGTGDTAGARLTRDTLHDENGNVTGAQVRLVIPVSDTDLHG